MKKISIIVLLTIIFKTSFAQIIYIQNTKLGIKAGFLKTDSAFLQALGDTTKYRYLGATILDSNTGYNYVYKKKGWDRILYVTDTSVFYSKKDTLSVYWGKIKGNIPQQTDLYMSLNEKIRYVDTAVGTGIATKYDLIDYIRWNDTLNIIASLSDLSKKVNYLDTMLMLSPYLRKTGLNAVSPLSYNSNTNTYSINKASNNIAGYIDTAKYNEWDRKQNSLGFVPENIANKSSSLIFNSDNLYPTQNAVREYIASVITGTQILQGSWNASTNTPDITGTTQAGYYWIVNVAGTFSLGGINSWAIGDWALKTQSGWTKILNTNSVSSVFGRTGAINATNGDYNTNQVTENTNLYYTNSRARSSISLTNTGNSGNASYNSSTGVFNIPNYTAGGIGAVPANSAITGSTFTKITFDSKGLVTGGTNATTSDITEGTNRYFTDDRVALNQYVSANTLARHNALTLGGSSNGLSLASGQVLTMLLANNTQNGALSMGDWIAFNNKQNALTNPITGTGTINTIPKFTGGTTIGNSNLVDNGTNIIINKQIFVNDTFISLSSLAGYNFNTNLRFYGNFNPSLGDNGARRVADIFAGFSNKTGGYSWGNEYMSFNVGNNGQPNDNSLPTKEIMRLTNTGLGIGNTNPSTFLDIYNSNSNIQNISLTYNNTIKGGLGSGSSIGFNIPTTSGGNNKFPLAIIKGSPYNQFSGDSTGAILFQTYQNGTGNYNYPLSLTGENGGKAGIGVLFPTEKLDIGGTIKQMNCINGMVKADGTGRLICATPNVDYVKPANSVTPPTIPITCTAFDGAVSISWTPPNDINDTLQMIGYNLYNQNNFNNVNTYSILPQNNIYNFNGLTNGTQYKFKFQTITKNGVSSYQNCIATPNIPSTNTISPSSGIFTYNNWVSYGYVKITSQVPFVFQSTIQGNYTTDTYQCTLNLYNSSGSLINTNINTGSTDVIYLPNGTYKVEMIGEFLNRVTKNIRGVCSLTLNQ